MTDVREGRGASRGVMSRAGRRTTSDSGLRSRPIRLLCGCVGVNTRRDDTHPWWWRTARLDPVTLVQLCSRAGVDFLCGVGACNGTALELKSL